MQSRPWHAFYPGALGAEGNYPTVPLWVLLQNAAGRHPHKLALVDGRRRLSYAELWRGALEVAGGLNAEPGDRVALHLPNSAAYVEAYFGALCAGCVVVPTNPELDPELEDSGARLVIDREPKRGTPKEPVANELALLQYTSGTTARPKAAMLSHENLVANALQNVRWFAWGQDVVNLAVLPLYHVWGMCVCLNSTIAVGGTLVLAGRFDPKETFDFVEEYGASVLYGSATMFHRLLDEPPRAVPSLRHLKAGAMLSQGDLKARWDERYPHAPLQQGYGLTEASPECHNNPPQRFKPGTVGIPIQDTDCRIVDGEVQIRGPQVTRGYWNQPEETRDAFDDGWLKTGDLGEMDDEGYLVIVDRKKDMLKFRGWTITPNRVEECLLRHAAVREAVVVGRPDDRDGDVPTAFVVVAGEVTDVDLLEHCRKNLARFEVPREIRRVAAIPRNHVGKPLRRELRARLR